jgi:deoxyadenosine/deoxycytidine kinase
MFIAIAGPIGVGKTTTVKEICKRLDFTPLFETVENHPYLEKFYKYLDLYSKEPNEINKELCHAYSFRTQEFFLKDRWLKHMSALGSNKNIIADRTIYEDTIFADMLTKAGNMSCIDHERVYLPMFDFFSRFLPHPDLLIYLIANVDVLLSRINKRNRDMENTMSAEYLENLCQQYEKWVLRYTHPIIFIDTNKVSLDEIYWNSICARIEQQAKNLKMNIRRKELI